MLLQGVCLSVSVRLPHVCLSASLTSVCLSVCLLLLLSAALNFKLTPAPFFTFPANHSTAFFLIVPSSRRSAYPNCDWLLH